MLQHMVCVANEHYEFHLCWQNLIPIVGDGLQILTQNYMESKEISQ